MIEWSKPLVQDLVERMSLSPFTPADCLFTPESRYGDFPNERTLLFFVATCTANKWMALGYDETDRISCIHFLHQLGYAFCSSYDPGWTTLHDVLSHFNPCPVSLVESLISFGCPLGKDLLHLTAECQDPLSEELLDILLAAGADPATPRKRWRGPDMLGVLAEKNRTVLPRVTGKLLAAGCRMRYSTDLAGKLYPFDPQKKWISNLKRIVSQYEQWRSAQLKLTCENDSPETMPQMIEWDR